jgi:predicted Rossmann fold flavoprotein
MFAAARAAERGVRVVLLEKNPSLGKKLLITGGGRCNVTNRTLDTRALLERYGAAREFLFSAFSQFDVADTITYFEGNGVPLKEENERRMFPVSDSARSIYEVLVHSLTKSEVEVQTNAHVRTIAREGDVFVVHLAHGEVVRARAVVIATGGTSRPETGSTGDAHAWLRGLGHTIVENDFALVPVTLSDAWAKTLGGITLTDVKMTLRADGVKVVAKIGKILFTHFGVSGPTILNMSKKVGELLEHSDVTIELDLFPTLDHGALRDRLRDLLAIESNKMLKNTLRELMPTALIAPLLALAQIDGDTKNHSVRSEDRKALVQLLKAVALHPSGLLGADKAIVSSGGVPLTEVDLRTMESRIVPGLYLVGDVLDIDRPSGGYSLQLCWTTGHVAGTHA